MIELEVESGSFGVGVNVETCGEGMLPQLIELEVGSYEFDLHDLARESVKSDRTWLGSS